MGATPFSDFFKARKAPATSEVEEGVASETPEFSSSDKLSIVEQLESSA